MSMENFNAREEAHYEDLENLACNLSRICGNCKYWNFENSTVAFIGERGETVCVARCCGDPAADAPETGQIGAYVFTVEESLCPAFSPYRPQAKTLQEALDDLRNRSA